LNNSDKNVNANFKESKTADRVWKPKAAISELGGSTGTEPTSPLCWAWKKALWA